MRLSRILERLAAFALILALAAGFTASAAMPARITLASGMVEAMADCPHPMMAQHHGHRSETTGPTSQGKAQAPMLCCAGAGSCLAAELATPHLPRLAAARSLPASDALPRAAVPGPELPPPRA
ncbi:MAG: hypothetical protein J0I45_16970 [Bosea sp.]|nr:hypothetical protein [Bosea sp. (in: a-proteobacteria)]